MRHVSRSLCALLSMALYALSQAPEETMQVRPTLTEAKYCRESTSLTTLVLIVSLEYVNSSSAPVILSKITYHSGVFLSRTYDDAAARRYKQTVAVKGPSLPSHLAEPLEGPTKQFEVVPPGRSVFREHRVVLALDQSGNRRALLRPGNDVYVQIDIEHWPVSQSETAKLRSKWQEHGVLFAHRIRTSPVRVHVERVPRITNCSRDWRM